MSFHPPYKFRICTSIGDEVFELVRFKRAIFSSDIRFWSEGREDRTWVERPLLNKETDTDRPYFRDLSKPGNVRVAVKLSVEETRRLRQEGLLAAFQA